MFLYKPVRFKYIDEGKEYEIYLMNMEGAPRFYRNKIDLTAKKMSGLYTQEYLNLERTVEKLKKSIQDSRQYLNTLNKNGEMAIPKPVGEEPFLEGIGIGSDSSDELNKARLRKELVEKEALLRYVEELLSAANRQFPWESSQAVQKDALGERALKKTASLNLLLTEWDTENGQKKKLSSRSSDVLSGLRMLSSVYYRVNHVILYTMNPLDNDLSRDEIDISSHLECLAMEAACLKGHCTSWLRDLGICCLVLTGALLIVGGILSLPIYGGTNLLPEVVSWANLSTLNSLISSLTHLSASGVACPALTLSVFPMSTAVVGFGCFFGGRDSGQASAVKKIVAMKETIAPVNEGAPTTDRSRAPSSNNFWNVNNNNQDYNNTYSGFDPRNIY